MNIASLQSSLTSEVVSKVVDQIHSSYTAYHSLDKKEIADTAGHGLWCLLQNQPQNMYLPRKKTGLACGLVVDHEKRRVILVLRKRGSDYARYGSHGKESRAIEIAITTNGIQISSMRCYIDNEHASLEYAMKYGAVTSIARNEKRVYYTCSGLSMANPTEDFPLLEMIKQVGSTLTRMHRDGVTHGNISPKNILYNKKSGFDLTNFLLAGNRASQNTLYGTPNFTSPEMMTKTRPERTVEANKAADWYALGCTIFERIYKKKVPMDMTSQRKATVRKHQERLSLHFTSQIEKHAAGIHRIVYSLFEGLLSIEADRRMNGQRFFNLMAAFINYPETSIDIEGNKVLLRYDRTLEPIVIEKNDEETSSARQSPQLTDINNLLTL